MGKVFLKKNKMFLVQCDRNLMKSRDFVYFPMNKALTTLKDY